jgi:hypothetical protein
MTYHPKCVMTWREQQAGADDQLSYSERTVEQVMTDLNKSLAALSEIEKLPMPLDEMAMLRKSVHEYIAARAIKEACAIQDMRAAVAKAKETA